MAYNSKIVSDMYRNIQLSNSIANLLHWPIHRKDKEMRKSKEYCVTTWLDEDLLKLLDDYCTKYDLSRSVFIRSCIRTTLNNRLTNELGTD